MSYLYKIPYDLISDEYSFSRDYIPVKKKIKYLGYYQKIAIYRKSENSEGICGFGYIMGQPKKTSELNEESKKKLFDRTMFQLPVRMYSYSRFAEISRKYLYQFPSLNGIPLLRPWNECVLYRDNRLNYEIDYLSYRFPFSPFLSTPLENEFQLKIHVLREFRLPSKFYRLLAAKAEKCSICSFPNPQMGNFFELHETIEIDFSKPFVPIESKNFIVVCPTCHKIEHQKIKFKIFEK